MTMVSMNICTSEACFELFADARENDQVFLIEGAGFEKNVAGKKYL